MRKGNAASCFFFSPRQDPSALRRDPDDAADAWHGITTLFDRIGITVPSTDGENYLELYAKITYRNKS